VRLAIPDLISNSYFPALAAAELGCFAAEGLDVSAELIFPVDRAYQALRDGEVDLVGGAAHGALAAFPEWQGVRLLGALAQGMYWFLVMHADFGIARGDLSGVKGRQIGAAPWVEMGLRHLLAAGGIDLRRDGVRIAPVPGAVGSSVNFGLTAAQALERREIDGFWANGMATEIAVRGGFGSIVLDVRRGDGPRGCFDYTFGALAARADMPRETAAAARRALVAAQRLLKADPGRATEVGRKRFPEREAGLIAGIVARDLPYYDATITPAALEAVNAFARAMSLVDEEADYRAVVAAELAGLW
jgi:ABC-type nitrate/sulfonate/bicarbonate transport system substrate-binding protein